MPSVLEDDTGSSGHSPGYSSDPEGDPTHVRKPDDRELRDNESVVRGRGRRSRRDVKTAPLQDLVKCVFFLLNPHTLLLD